VYLPPGYDPAAAPLPALWDLAAFTNSGPGHLNWRHRGENLAERLDRLIAQEEMPPVVVAMPDCFTSLGGNQYLNSPGVGRYADYLIQELIPLVEAELQVIPGPEGRGAFGKSSGGYGALVQAMQFPGVWGAVASPAGDIGFEWVYRPGFPVACRVLAEFGGESKAFLRHFWESQSAGPDEYAALLTLAMAASYDPDPRQPDRIQLPFDLQTCTLHPERWARWLEHDPLCMVERHADGLRALRALYIDVGSRDEYHIQFGTRAFISRLEDLGVDHHFVEFEGTHRNLDLRLDHSLPLLARALEPR